MTQPGRRSLVLLLAGVVVLKALLLFGAFPRFQHADPEAYAASQFPDRYDLIATNLLTGHGYRIYPETSETLLRAPAFPLILAGIFALAGPSLPAVEVFNLLASLLAAWLLYRLARRLACTGLEAALACALFLFHPGTLMAESRGGVECTFTLSIVLFAWLAYRALDTYRHRDFALAGAALGFGLLVKSTLAPALPALFLYSLVRRPRGLGVPGIVARYATCALVVAALLSPWVVRNYRLTGRFIAATTLGGLSAHDGLYVYRHRASPKEHFDLLEDAAREQQQVAAELHLRMKPAFFPQFYSVHDELLYYQTLADRVQAEYRRSPGTLAKVSLFNLWAFWFQGRTRRATLLNLVLTVPLLLLVLGGLVLAARRRARVGPLLLVIGAFVAVHLPILGVARFHVPLVPLLSLFAALPLALALGRLRPAAARSGS